MAPTKSKKNCEISVTDVGEALVAAMGAAGVDYIFFTSGSEICFFQEAVAKSQAIGRAAPKLITIPHEHIGLNAALGYAAVSGKPAVTAVHVDAGTLHQGAAIHTAYRSRLPVLMTAGGAPTAYPGSMKGARSVGGHIWMQETYDQHALIRQYVKWDHRLCYADNPGLVVGRALQLATTQPAGPVFLSLPSEISFLEIDHVSFPPLDQFGIPVPPEPDRNHIRQLAKRLLQAVNPYIVVSGSGKNPDSVLELAKLAELLGAAVVNSVSRAYQCIPMNHPLYQGSRSLADADLVLVLDADIPWMPGLSAPPPEAYVAVIDLDPARMNFPTYEFMADLRLMADPHRAILALIREISELASPEDRSKCAARAERWADTSSAHRKALVEEAKSRSTKNPIDPLWLGYQINEALEDGDILIDETLPGCRFHEFVHVERPGTYFCNPGTAGGWAPGAALGAKFAAPERDVIAVSGDGFYMFGTPVPALWAAKHYKRPFMMIVYQNRSYTTGTHRLNSAYPDSFASKEPFDYQGGYFDPPVDFAKEAESAGAYGENVRDPAEIMPAIKRGRAKIREGVPAVISVWLPKILKAD